MMTEDDTTHDGPRAWRIPRSRAVFAGGGRSRVRTWVGLADDFTGLWRNRSDLRERQVLRLFGHALGMVAPLPAVPRAPPVGNLTTPQSLWDRDLDSVLIGGLRPRATYPPR